MLWQVAPPPRHPLTSAIFEARYQPQHVLRGLKPALKTHEQCKRQETTPRATRGHTPVRHQVLPEQLEVVAGGFPLSAFFFFTPVALTKNRGSLRLVPPPATTTAHSKITMPPSGLTSSTLRTGRPQHQEERGGGSGHTSDSRCSSTRGCSLIAPPKKKGRLKVQAGLDAALRAPSPFAPTSSKPRSEGCHEVGAPSCCWHRPGAAGSSPPL